MTLLFAGIIFDMAQVFDLIFVFVFFGNLSSIDSNGWMVFLTISMTFVFFKILGLRLTYVNR